MGDLAVKNKNKEKTIEKYELEKNKESEQKIILIILIIIILLLYLLSYIIGKISYQGVFSPSSIEDIKIIEVTSDDIEITKDTELNIFKNEKFGNKQMIAPKSEGSQKFYIKNITKVYNINFIEEKRLPINMKYRLKMDNIYIKGNENDYVYIEQLSVKDIMMLENSSSIFTLEWYWEDDDKLDTYIGSLKADEYYTLKLNIETFEKINN